MQSSVIPALIPGARYILRDSILSVYRRDDRHVFLRIPAGEEVSVVGEERGTPFTRVRWQSELVQIFALDLEERAQRVNASAIPGDLSSSYLAASA